jgi:SH3-like domain-containing protein
MEVMKHKSVQNYLAYFYSFLFLAIFLILLSVPKGLCAQDIPTDKKEMFSSTGLPIPRFVSLGKEITNVRTGPGQQYPIRWVYKKQGLPVEVILEYDHWRKIRDHEGSEGWVYKTLLSGHRTALIIGTDIARAYDQNPDKYPLKAKVAIVLEPLSLVSINTCEKVHCYIEVSNLYGWIEKKSLWGVYETEKFD